jgi:multiple sugar transport system substrate-binding protein
MTKLILNRRALLGGAAAGALALGAGSSAIAQPAVRRGTRLTFWGGLIFSERANRLVVDTVTKWGQDNGVTTEVVMVNQNETTRQVSAAIAAGTMPDALDLQIDLLLLLARQNQLLPIDDLHTKIGREQGGWFPSIERATDTSSFAGGRTGLAYGASGNLLLRRNDLLSRAGFREPPSTWAQLVEQSQRLNRPPFHALGFALSNVGDGNAMIGVLQSHGGRIADDQGRRAAIKSDATREFLRWVKDAWDKRLFPPGVTTWDGAGDNNAYLSGQTAFIANTGSVGIAAKTQDPELYRSTLYSSLPGGPRGVVSPITPVVRSIARSSRNPEAARDLLEHLAQPAFTNAYFENAIFGPATMAQARLPAFNAGDPILAGLLDLVQRGTAPGAPDVYNAAFADMWSNFVVPRMIQRVVVDGWDFDRAMDQAQAQVQSIYDKYA